MNRIVNSVPITMMRYLSGNKQHFQPCQANRFINDLKTLGRFTVFRFDTFALLMSGNQFEPAPQVVGQHHDLKIGMIALELLRRNSQNAFSLSLADRVFYIGSFVILGDDIMRLAGQVRDKNAIDIQVFFEQWQLASPFCSFFIRITTKRQGFFQPVG